MPRRQSGNLLASEAPAGRDIKARDAARHRAQYDDRPHYTAPMEVLLFIIKALNGIRLSDMIRELWPHLLLLIAVLFLITYLPDLVLWLPRQAGAMQ